MARSADTPSAPTVPGWGVDGCRAGWVAARIVRGVPTFALVPDFESLLALVPAGEPVLVDIPIGLRDDGPEPRACDVLARRLLGPRRSSVFPAPVRAVLDRADYADANATSRARTAKGLTRQTFHVIPKIAEVDRALRASRERARTVRESHPEVCFRELAGGRPMARPKRTREGLDERFRVLARRIPRGVNAIREAIERFRGRAAGDDVVDATVLGVTAALPPARQRTLPDRPEKDALGLPMQMVVPRAGE